MTYRLHLQAQNPREFDDLVNALLAARGAVWFQIEILIEGVWIEMISRDDARRWNKGVTR